MNIIDAITEMHFAKPIEGHYWGISNPYLFNDRHVYLTNTNHADVLRMNFFAPTRHEVSGDVTRICRDSIVTIKCLDHIAAALKSAYCPSRNELLRQDWFLVSVNDSI